MKSRERGVGSAAARPAEPSILHVGRPGLGDSCQQEQQFIGASALSSQTLLLVKCLIKRFVST